MNISQDAIVAADFYTSRAGSVVDINVIENGQRRRLHTQPVSGKREARRVAVEYGASPWNF